MNKQAKRRIEKGILGIGILLVTLVMATGSASANGVCVWGNINNGEFYQCGQTVTQSCTLNATMDCSGTTGHGLVVGANGITIDGNASSGPFAIKGNTSSTSWIVGIYNSERDNVVIKNLEIKNFRLGVFIYGSSGNSLPENNTIDNCEIHDNGKGDTEYEHGIDLYCANNSKITNCTIYNNTGVVTTGCETGGHGIRLYGCECGASGKGYHTVKNNTIYNNTMAGIYSKMGVKHCNVTYNKVYENGKDVGSNAYFGGGIRLECVQTNNWTVEHNNVTNNLGPGIFVRGKYNNFTHNNVTNSTNASSYTTTSAAWGPGSGFFSCSEHNNITANRFCYNEYKDVYNHNDATGTTGDDNTCDWTSNYNDAGTSGCTYRCMHAYRYEAADKPPSACDVPNTEFTDAQYDNIESDDGTRQEDESTSNYAAHRFNFSVIWDASDIDKINVTWNGNGSHEYGDWPEYGYFHGANLSIWNFTAGEYELLQASAGNTENEVTLTGEKASSISSYINSGNMTILVEQKTEETDSYSYIKTDYIKVVITT